MRVLIVSNIYPSKKYPAFATFVQAQVVALEQQGIECLLAINTDPRLGLGYALCKYALLTLQALRFAFFAHFDVVHAHYIFPSALIGWLVSFLRGKPLVITAHGGDVTRMPYRHKIIWYSTHFLLHRAAAIIAVSNDLKREITARFSIDGEKILVANMGIDIQFFLSPIAKSDACICLEIPYYETHRRLLFVGRYVYLKGGQFLIEAIAKLPREMLNDLEVWFVGDGPERADWENQSHVLGLSKIIHFVGARPHAEMPAWYAIADVLVLPTLTESFGLVVLEAMAGRVPVIASRVGGIPELIEDGVNGLLVNPKDVNALVESIRQVLENREFVKRLTDNASRGIEHHSVETQAKNVIHYVYQRLYEQPKCN